MEVSFESKDLVQLPPMMDIAPKTQYGRAFSTEESIATNGDTIPPTRAKLLHTPIPTFLLNRSQGHTLARSSAWLNSRHVVPDRGRIKLRGVDVSGTKCGRNREFSHHREDDIEPEQLCEDYK